MKYLYIMAVAFGCTASSFGMFGQEVKIQAESKVQAEAKTHAQRLEMVMQLPKNLGGDVAVDLTQMDVLSKKSLQELLDEKFAQGMPFIMARVTMQKDASGAKNFSYYCAHKLNAKLFTENGFYPLPEYPRPIGGSASASRISNHALGATLFHSARALYKMPPLHGSGVADDGRYNKPLVDPKTKVPVQAVHYFIAQPLADEGFAYFCSHNQLFSEGTGLDAKVWLNKFYANQMDMFCYIQMDLEWSARKQFLALKDLYDYAQEAENAGRHKQKIEALHFVVQQPVALDAAVVNLNKKALAAVKKDILSAHIQLADVYRNGAGVPVNYQRARQVLEMYRAIVDLRPKSADKTKKLKQVAELLAEVDERDAAARAGAGSGSGSGAGSSSAGSGSKRPEHPETDTEAGQKPAKKQKIDTNGA